LIQPLALRAQASSEESDSDPAMAKHTGD